MSDQPFATRERDVIAIVEELVREIDGGRLSRAVGPGSSLDRDLGIGSLERVELLLRLEKAFGVRLSDHAMAGAGTVADLVRVTMTLAPADPRADDEPVIAAQGDGAAAPPSIRTLVDALRWHVDRTPDRVHIFLREDEGPEQAITYAALWDEAAAVASGLQARGIRPGECVALLLRTERAFFTSYYGTLLAGAIPVPLYPPFRADRIREYATRQSAILRNAEARVLVTFDQVERLAGLLRPLAPDLTWVTTAGDVQAAGARGAAGPRPSAVAADRLALIQYTSGSTGTPKGVALSHANLVANIRAFGQALGVRPDDVGVSWLPLYHDMGLIGMWLGALFHGVPVVVMSPLAFLSRPSRWLRAFDAHRGTMSAAPNFAFDLCARKIPDDEVADLDLRSWRAALNGAEAVGSETIDRFVQRFEPHGFRRTAMCPVYGLAETSLCLTVPPMGEAPVVDRIAREAFQRTRAIVPAPPEEPSLAFVGCGRPVPTTEMRIVDDAGRVLGDRVEGRIQFRGPSATAGYYRNPEATAELIDADGWLDTGDLGYWAAGHVFITGRRKDVIIAGGRNIYPEEIEGALASVPGVRRGCIAAFGSFDPAQGTERLVVVAETRERDPERRRAVETSASALVFDLIGMPPDVVALVPPGALPKTSSGKIRRHATRDLYERGALAGGGTSAWRQWAGLLGQNLLWRTRLGVTRLLSAVFTLYLWILVGAGLVVLRALIVFARRPEQGGRVSRAWCRGVFRLGTFRVRYPDARAFDGLDGAVFVANHASFMDALLLRAALPAHVRMAAKDRLLAYAFVGPIMAGSNVIAITRGQEASAADLTALVRAGGSFAIFPEGTFTRAPGLLPFRLGAFRAAVESRRPIVPVALKGTRRAWPDGTLLVRRVPLEVTVTAPIHPEGDGWPEMVRLRDRAREMLAAATGEPAFQAHSDDTQARASGRM